jgi:NAD(P)-dependent dehydrogenase (short-subunit alcohol dehydrogenase family)
LAKEDNAMNLVGRTAIITGANRGLGLAIAHAYVKAGASALLAARDEVLLRQVGEELSHIATEPRQQVHVMRADVAASQDCTALVRRAREVFGKVTILVNNAGLYGPMGNIETIDWDEWVQAIQVNLLGTVFMCREIIPIMREQGYGKIVNLSGGGATAALPRISAYAASKAAVVRMTETLAEEVRDSRIDVNAIAPGALNTRLLDEVLAAGPEKVGSDFYRRSLEQREQGGTPLEKGASLAVFLGSAASDAITGRLISAVWDDWAALPEKREQLSASDVYTLRRIVPQDRGLKW